MNLGNKNNYFHLLPNIYCALQFLIKEITTNKLKKIITQPDQNLKQNQHKDTRNPEQNTNKFEKIRKKLLGRTYVRTRVKEPTKKIFNSQKATTTPGPNTNKIRKKPLRDRYVHA